MGAKSHRLHSPRVATPASGSSGTPAGASAVLYLSAAWNQHPGRGLVKEFKKGPRAVDGIDLEVATGEIYGFLGPNGAGKSTTVHMLTTLLPPTDGSARVAGFDVQREGARVREQIGAALQEAALDPFLTAREHMRLQGALHGLPKDERERRGAELIARVGLVEAADRKVGTYSGGMRRRLDLALALVHEPRILFLDEPTTGLDPQSRSALWEEVERLARDDGVTVFLTTQYLEEADRLADRVGIIDHGRIVAEGTPDELKAAIGEPSVEAVPAAPGGPGAGGGRAGALRGPGDCPHPHEDGVAVRLDRGATAAWPTSCARSTARASRWRTSSCTRPRSTTSSSRRPAAASRARASDDEEATRPRRSAGRGVTRSSPPRSAAVAAPLDGAHRAPARADRAGAGVPAVPARDQRRRARCGHRPARLPDRLLPDLRAGGARSSRAGCSPS